MSLKSSSQPELQPFPTVQVVKRSGNLARTTAKKEILFILAPNGIESGKMLKAARLLRRDEQEENLKNSNYSTNETFSRGCHRGCKFMVSMGNRWNILNAF